MGLFRLHRLKRELADMRAPTSAPTHTSRAVLTGATAGLAVGSPASLAVGSPADSSASSPADPAADTEPERPSADCHTAESSDAYVADGASRHRVGPTEGTEGQNGGVGGDDELQHLAPGSRAWRSLV